MYVNRRLSRKQVLFFSLYSFVPAGLWASFIYLLYAYGGLEFIKIPFLPIATIGTAVAFYVGFKNNAAYERFWEGRKIWGAIVNASRTWGTDVMSYVDVGDESERAQQTRKELIYRHMAWMNALRLQLRKNSRFFNKPARATKKRLENHAEAMRNDWDTEISGFLSPEEFEEVTKMANSATHLLTEQGKQLAQLVKEGRMDLFHQIAMMEVVEELYTHQGKCERIKNTPFPRFYAEYSRIFVRVFVFLLPFGMLDVFTSHLEAATTTYQTLIPIIPMIAASGLVTWVFFTMESVGDATEDPFERSMNDVPMNALCRTIEIDMRQMLGETDLPPKEAPIDNILY